MQEKTMVRILQNTQHDLMNNLQVIQGYLSMEKIDMVKTKLADCIDYYQEERKLININAPHFILWVMQFNHAPDNIELSYRIYTENVDLSKIDLQLVQKCEEIVKIISAIGKKRELYQMKLELTGHSQTNVTMTISMNGEFDRDNFIQRFDNNECSYVYKSDDGMICEHSYPV